MRIGSSIGMIAALLFWLVCRTYSTILNVDNKRRVTLWQSGQSWIPRLPTFGITYEFGGGAGR